MDDPLFRIDLCQVKRGTKISYQQRCRADYGAVEGPIGSGLSDYKLSLKAGDFVLLPASLGRVTLTADTQVEFLHVQNR